MSPNRAIEEYERLLASGPTPRVAQEAQMGIGALEFAKGDYRRARESFRQALRQASDWDLVKYGTYQLKEIDRRIAWAGSQRARQAECGVQTLHEVLRSRGLSVSVEQVAARVESDLGTASLAALRTAAEELGLRAVGARPGYGSLRDLPKPLIAHLHPNHFVVVIESGDGGLRIVDPHASGEPLSLQQFRQRWSGSALLFLNEPPGDLALLSEAEMRKIRGGHHLHGNNLGDQSSNPASPYHSCSSSPNPGCRTGLPNISVNLSNFNLLVQDTDFAYGGLGPAVYLQRTYNADDPEETVFGRSWSFNYGVHLEEQASGDVNLRRESGKEDFFTLTGCTGGTCTYDPPLWSHDELTKNPDGTFDLRVKRTRHVQHFDLGGRLTAIEGRNGNAVTLGYDTAGRLVTVTDAAGRVTSFSYGADGKVSKVIDPAGREATFSYDAAGNMVENVDMTGNVVSYSYDANSYMDSLTTPSGTWSITNVPYDDPAFGLVVESITDPLGHTTTYSTPGLVVVEVEDPNGIVWQYFPVGDGELDSVTDPLGNTTEFRYDFDGDLTRVIDAEGNTTRFSWDSRGNLTRVTDPLGHEVDLTYDEDDNLTRLVDPLSNAYDYLYDSDGNLTQITDAAGGITVFTYDAAGQVTSLSDARGKTTAFAYDSEGNMTSMTTPLGKQTLYGYDDVGRPVSVTTPRGVTRTFQWDGIDRLTKVTYPDGSEVDYVYGCCQLESVSGPAGTTTFTYDAGNRPVSYTDVWGNTIGYTLDPGGRLTALTYPDGKVVTYDHDDAGRLTAVTDWLLNTTTHSYDALGRLTRTDHANGTMALHTYDAAGRLTSLTNAGTDGGLISRYAYTYDALGNRTGVELYEPVPPSIPDETVTYQHNDDNRLTLANDVVFGYDDDGNQISRTDGSDVTTYEYDFDGRLLRVEQGGQATQFLYDDLGTRVGKFAGAVETREVVNPLAGLSQLLMETDGAGNPLRYYVYGLGLQSMIMPGGQSYAYHYDLLGSTVAMTDDGGTSISQYGYRPYGQVFSSASVSTALNHFQFVGRLGVRESGDLSNMRLRFYDPTLGRFISPDPLGTVEGPVSYLYAFDNPIHWTDPNGDAALAVAGAVITVALAAYAAWKIAQILPSSTAKVLDLGSDLVTGQERNGGRRLEGILKQGGADAASELGGIGGNPIPGWFVNQLVDERFPDESGSSLRILCPNN